MCEGKKAGQADCLVKNVDEQGYFIDKFLVSYYQLFRLDGITGLHSEKINARF